jgi:hypothetical protein
MTINFKMVCLASALLASSSSLASAQGGSTDSRGNAMGSEHVGNGAASTGGAVQQGMHETTGTNTKRSEQDSPNGSLNTPPTSKEVPGGDPSRNADAPK